MPASYAKPLLTAGTLQSFMLDEGHLDQLKLDTQIEPQHFEQYEAEAVFIPAGCPHQVRQGLGLKGVSTRLTPSGSISWQMSKLQAESVTAATVC